MFGRPVRDFLPVKLGLFKPSEVWLDCREKRELAMRHRLSLGAERWSVGTRQLPPLQPGQHVLVQNQQGVGKMAKRWDRTGVVIKDDGYDKYRVKIDGTGRITHQNRRFLRSFKPNEDTAWCSVAHREGGNKKPTMTKTIPLE